jgi:hypothetical protein
MRARVLFLTLLCVSACSPDTHPTPSNTQVTHAPATHARPTPSASPVSTKASCAQARTALDGIRTPLDLLKQGGTPVSWTDDLRAAQARFAVLGAATNPPVGTFEAGLSEDLDRLTAALDAQETSTVHAVADVISGRINNLTYQCRQ